MKLTAFIKDKCLLLLLHIVCMLLLSGFLGITGYGRDSALLILVVWGLILSVFLGVSYFTRRRYFREIEDTMKHIDRQYLLGELLPKSFRLEDRIYQEMIRKSNKSVIERIRQMEEQQKEYREYIESWVHEVKAPISGIASICENRRKNGVDKNDADMTLRETFTDILQENRQIENFVDMALYYARSENVYKDYFIAQTALADAVYEALSKNRLLFIQNQARAEVDCPDFAYTDQKWLVFILNQLFLNSIKYRREHLLVRIYSKAHKDSVLLAVEDNGLGIPESELSRIFEKGFTGSNGRRIGGATGMGLYLCCKLCKKLGIRLWAESEYGVGTKVILEFPIGTFTLGTDL